MGDGRCEPESCCSVGSRAPDFQLDAVSPELNEITVSLRSYRSRWLALVFYPRDFSFVCPTELTGFSAEKEQFDKRNCELLGISIDGVGTHVRWLQTAADEGGVSGLRIPLASDPAGDVCRACGVWREPDALPNRGLLLIDPDGIVRYSVVHDMAVGRSVEDVLRVLDALQSGGLCPVNWKQADGLLDVTSLLLPERVLGHYRIEQELGQGGFGRVFAAKDIRLHRKVALKVLGRQSDASEERLLEEARIAARISHPNVCAIYAVDVIDTLPTIVMEFIDGPTLTEVIKSGGCSDDFHVIARNLAAGLAAAHAREVVHGDIKPANVMLREKTDPVLVDFGLARLRLQSRANIADVASHETTTDSSLDHTVLLTAPDQQQSSGKSAQSTGAESVPGIAGTLAYMSPEQARGQRLSEASDMFSLGLLFVEMLCGQTPLDSLSAIETLTALEDARFIESIPERLPASERDLLADLFAPDPADRPTAVQLRERINNVLRHG